MIEDRAISVSTRWWWWCELCQIYHVEGRYMDPYLGANAQHRCETCGAIVDPGIRYCRGLSPCWRTGEGVR